MKILLSAIPFDNGKSGISVYIREVVKALENAGHELTLIVEDDGAEEFARFELIKIKKRRALFSMLYSLFILPLRILYHACRQPAGILPLSDIYDCGGSRSLAVSCAGKI